ncbi:hypothetical protein QQS21_007831 [Conoideocrella luteorostrata]|uniref:BZIP domain-containing protein n=1 Tax=Conoideocrella luteorostrata TaxID=1105319 RepID=A0AAJ0CMS0_9HYPO|nr:hypothetical protein QQS21_007831 [Conoideocrella luteorostrata]
MDAAAATVTAASRYIAKFFRPQQRKIPRPPCNFTSSDSSPDNSPPWPLPLEDFVIFDQLQAQLPLAPPPTTVRPSASASPEELSLGLSPSFFQTPALSALDTPDMTYLGLFGGVDSGHVLGQNDDSHHRHSSHQLNHDILGQVSHNFLGSGLHILSHSHQDTPSMHNTTAALSHERLTTNSTKDAFFTARSAPSATSASSSSATSASSRLHISPLPKLLDPPASSGSAGSKRKHTASPPADMDPDSEDAQTTIKRQRNTMAARKYRQKRLDKISDLEHALSEVSGERDELKLQLARREAEVEALREMLSKK